MPPKDPFLGKTIGNCKIKELIAEGGTALVYKAYSTTFNMDRVVKILKPSLMRETEFFVNFKQEAQLTARLEHPHILRVYDTGEFEGHFFIEMDYIEGMTLRDYLFKKRKLTEAEIIMIALQLISALKYSHGIKIELSKGNVHHGVLHRDLKPENVMINKDKKVYLMDFGAAKPLSLTTETNQTLSVGTLHYMSPEQISGERLDARSDFFSLGIVLYELFTGRKPFEAHILPELIDKIKLANFPRLHKLRPSISPITEELIEHLLSRRPKHRPSSAEEIETELKRCSMAYNAWGKGKKVRVPFSFKKFYPTFALWISCAALILSGLNFWYSSSFKQILPTFSQSPSKASSLEKGKQMETQNSWRKAITLYESVPSPKDGGRPNEYLEAQIRLAYLSYKHFNQFTKARSILERLRLSFSDPSIDAYLGLIYTRQALYEEALDRFDHSFNSKKGSVIPQTNKFLQERLYYQATALDKQFTFFQKDFGLRDKAVATWKEYINISECVGNGVSKNCNYAKKRLVALQKIKAS